MGAADKTDCLCFVLHIRHLSPTNKEQMQDSVFYPCCSDKTLTRHPCNGRVVHLWLNCYSKGLASLRDCSNYKADGV